MVEQNNKVGKTNKLLLWGLVLLFAGLMSVPFLVPHCGFFALFGIVPLLCMDRIADLSGVKRVWIYHYSAFLLWNLITTFWVCNATVGGGLFASFANALQMSVVFGLFRLSKKYFKGILPYIFLMATWIAWERAYFDVDISWPWLVLGNAFARSVKSVQWYEFTGSLGGSLWIWLVNITIFRLMVALSDGSLAVCNRKAQTAVLVWTIGIILCPLLISRSMFNHYQEKEDPLEVIVFQPNIDPYHKFQALSQRQQNDILITQMEDAMAGLQDEMPAMGVIEPQDEMIAEAEPQVEPLLLLAPETFTNDITVGDYSLSPTHRRFVEFLQGHPGVNLLFGASAHSIFTAPQRPSPTARQLRDGRWYESYNSALMVDGTGRTEIFHKNKLVVGVEMMPYPKVFRKVDEWLGGVMGRCIGQDTISVLHCVSPSDTIAVGCAICYESVYGEYCTGYVKEGAEVMTVITNDAWWGNTPGYRQHLSYSSLRAIELRRSIARCANTGISGFIDQRGVIHDPSPWWEQAVLTGKINRNSDVTFFVRHGDICGRICTFLFWLLLLVLISSMLMAGRTRNAAAAGKKTTKKRHNQ